MENVSEGELVEMLPHRWILHLEVIITYSSFGSKILPTINA